MLAISVPAPTAEGRVLEILLLDMSPQAGQTETKNKRQQQSNLRLRRLVRSRRTPYSTGGTSGVRYVEKRAWRRCYPRTGFSNYGIGQFVCEQSRSTPCHKLSM